MKILENRYNLENKYIFTFVRNPYDRIESWYYYHKSLALEPYKSKSLNEWIQQGCQTHWRVQNRTNWVGENISHLLQYNFTNRIEYEPVKSNTSNRTNKETISDKKKDIIYHMFKKDFDYFEYAK